jgi:hypothetical protein
MTEMIKMEIGEIQFFSLSLFFLILRGRLQITTQGYQGFCDYTIKASVMRSVTIVNEMLKLRDIIYG